MKGDLGVHQTHCCVKHGCKYGDADCPVETGECVQDFACEYCGLEESGYYGNKTPVNYKEYARPGVLKTAGRLIFLDIDGVLNAFGTWKEGDPMLNRGCIEQLNVLLEKTNAQLVISSSWRYQMISGETTCAGFERMLESHGLHAPSRLVVGHTVSDEEIEGRGNQILDWIERNKYGGRWVVLDDDDFDTKEVADRLVLTKSSVGLTASEVEKALKILS